MLTAAENELLEHAKVGDVWYEDSARNGVRKLSVTKVTRTMVELGGNRISKRTGTIVGDRSYMMTWYYPATPERAEAFEPRIRDQKLRAKFRRLIDAIHEKDRRDDMSHADYREMIDAMGRVLYPQAETEPRG